MEDEQVLTVARYIIKDCIGSTLANKNGTHSA